MVHSFIFSNCFTLLRYLLAKRPKTKTNKDSYVYPDDDVELLLKCFVVCTDKASDSGEI